MPIVGSSMLKSFFLNKKKIPIPIPTTGLADLVSWVEKDILKSGQLITRLGIDGQDMDYATGVDDGLPNLPLVAESIVEMQVDTPEQLCIQSIDVLSNLCTILEKVLKPIAVDAWQTPPTAVPHDINDVIDDLELMKELIDHLQIWFERDEASGNLRNLRDLNENAVRLMKIAISQSDWRSVARLLLKQVEPAIMALHQELARLQEDLMRKSIGDQKASL